MLKCQTQSFCAPDVANIVIAKELNLNGVEYPNDGVQENGLGTITKGYGPIDVIQNSPLSTLQPTYTPATKPWLPLAQAVLFLHEIDINGQNARFPEPAGAASLASCLKANYDIGYVEMGSHLENGQHRSKPKPVTFKLNLAKLVFSLRVNGLDKESFEDILHQKCSAADPWEYIEQQAAIHGGNHKQFVRELHTYFDMTEEELLAVEEMREPKDDGLEHGQSFTFYDTGHNGMEVLKDKLLPKILANRDERIRELKRTDHWYSESEFKLCPGKMMLCTAHLLHKERGINFDRQFPAALSCW